MKRLIQSIIFFTILILTTGCFDVTEEIKMNADGSGELRLNINLKNKNMSEYN